MKVGTLKVALVWNHASRLLDCSFRFEQYVRGLVELGHEPVVVCGPESADGFDGPLLVADPGSDLATEQFWRQAGVDAAIIVTWHRMSEVLGAMRAAGVTVVAVTDTDGRVSPTVHPLAVLERMLVYQRGPWARLRCLRYWLSRYLRESMFGSAEEQEFLASTRASDVLVFGACRGPSTFPPVPEASGRGAIGRAGEDRTLHHWRVVLLLPGSATEAGSSGRHRSLERPPERRRFDGRRPASLSRAPDHDPGHHPGRSTETSGSHLWRGSSPGSVISGSNLRTR